MRTPDLSRPAPARALAPRAVAPAAPWRRGLASAGRAAGLAALLGGCAWLPSVPVPSVPNWLAPYRADVVQGNVVTLEQIKLVKVGMSRTQVRDVLGSPLLADAFHAQRWDYVFTLRRQGTAPIQRAMVVQFEGDNVSKVDAPDMPAENDFVASISREPLPTSSPKLELNDLERAALPAPKGVAGATAMAAPASAAATGARRSYPPLEPVSQ